VSERLGEEKLDKLSGLFIGTIHAYCFQFLQRFVPDYESYDVLDDNKHAAFLSREAYHIGLQNLGGQTAFEPIPTFLKSVDVFENELLGPESMPEPSC